MHFDIWEKERNSADVLPNGLRVLREDRAGKPCAMIWMPKAKKPVRDARLAFSSPDRREDYIARVMESFDEHQRQKSAARRNASQGDVTLADPGAIFCYSWGYEQTNVEYYQVVERRGLMLTLARIGTETVPGTERCNGSEHVRPKKDAFIFECAHCRSGQYNRSHYEGDREHHTYEPQRILSKKRLTFSQGEPMLSFSFGVGTLVKVVSMGGAGELIMESHYRSSYA